MPRLPIDYSRTIIYKLVHKDDLDDVNIYVGHTTDFTKRKNCHKNNSMNVNREHYYLKVYNFIRENGGFENWEMLKIEDYPCKDVNEAKNRERYWMKELKPKLNTTEPLRTGKEYYEDNKERCKEYRKEHYEDNKEKILEQNKQWYEKNKEERRKQINEYNQNNMENLKKKQKEWYENNKEKLREKHKQYNDDNREKRCEKVNCDKCGSEVSRHSLLRHKKSLKCQNHGSQ